jgi:hypothetical protein
MLVVSVGGVRAGAITDARARRTAEGLRHIGFRGEMVGPEKIDFYGRLGLKRRLTFQFVCQGIDWDSIQVEQKWEEEGLQRVYEKFGLRQDDEKEDEAREEGCDMSGERSLPTGLSNEPVCGDKLPNAEVAFCD